MNRSLTNAIRFLMDECLPPIIRDNRFFMRPFFWAAYGRQGSRVMDFKRDVYTFSESDYNAFYAQLAGSISRRRQTDLNAPSLKWIIDNVPDAPLRLLDVGCGNGFLLRAIAAARSEARLTGCDIVSSETIPDVEHHEALLPDLPYEDGEFDVVCCTHVLEHIIDLNAAARELMRITRDRLLVVVPRQRYYYYTLDEHVNFFHRIEPLLYVFRGHQCTVQRMGGDWAVMITK
jgi:SAM-dependent methyltransferase